MNNHIEEILREVAIELNDVRTRIPVHSCIEAGRLSRILDRLAGELGEAAEALRQF